ncbi:MAG: choice-of-anchor I family protein [Candidatus Cohnella colombiensis]|uniref:Choice-of-anchor I family protein n=1 Tax=Candidatus Cohnella colombiensis TaxID=3121368 RepID=A0AA95JC31_9BACL|nr:MAG: choice-of-anchor I family protein [Cohnella sp.]
MKFSGKKLLSLVLAAELLLSSFVSGGSAYAAPATPLAGTPYQANSAYDVTVPHVVINQIYGGGTDTTVTVSNGFIELYNPTDSDVNLTGWSLHYADAPITGVSTSWVKLDLQNTIKAHSSYLVVGADLNTTSPILNVSNSYDQKLVDSNGIDIFINNKGIKVALFSNTNVLTEVNPFNSTTKLPTVEGYVDMVGTAGNDAGNLIDGYETDFTTGKNASNSKKIAIRRIGFTDTDNNKTDFELVDYSATPLSSKKPRYSGDLAWGQALSLTTLTLPSGSVDSAYSAQITATGGTAPYTFTATGLPAGLTISSNGLISGTPTVITSANVSISVTDSASSPVTQSKTFALQVQNAAIPDTLSVTKIGQYTVGQSNSNGGVAEIVKYNSDNGKMYVVNGSSTPPSVDIVPLTNNATLTKEKSILVKALAESGNDGFTYGDLTSVDVNTTTKRVAVAIQEADALKNGKILVLDYDGNLLKTYSSGVQPDMVKFTSNGKYILTADEGEPRDGIHDPDGSVTIVDTTTNVTTRVKFDDPTVIDNLVHIRGASDPTTGQITSKGSKADAIFDLEPEYIALNEDETLAYVALQENNAIATIDIATKKVLSVKGLGFKDFNVPSNALDLVKDNAVKLENVPFYGMYMPDGIASYTLNGTQYLFTANEGDATEWPADAGKLLRTNLTKISKIKDSLDPSSSAAQFLNGKTIYDDVEVVSDMGNDGIYMYGGRSFSIWNASTLTQVYDSGSDFETITGQRFPTYFNASNSNSTLDNRSTKKGPEPEYVAVGQVGSKAFAFIGLERIGGLMTYDVTDPTHPKFANYINTRDFTAGLNTDTGPEGLEFIPATSSPTGLPLILVANEVGGTIAVLQMNVTKVTLDKSSLSLEKNGSAAQLQATVVPVGNSNTTVTWTSSDTAVASVSNTGLVTPGSKVGTAIITAISGDGYGVAQANVTVGYWNLTIMHTNDTHAHLADVARRATLVKQVRNSSTNSLLLDAGDVFSGDLYFTKWAGLADLKFMNALGYDAMTFGNHEFDSGTSVLADFIKAAQFPLVTSNIDFSKDSNISPLLKQPKTIDTGAVKSTADAGVYPYVILGVNGQKVGVFGLTTEDTIETSSPGKNVTFKAADASAAATVAAIENEGVNKIIALSHLGYNRDVSLAKAVEGIDLIVGGHTHTMLDAPVIVSNAHDAPTVIVQANEWGKFLGLVNLTFDNDGVILTEQVNGRLLVVDNTVAEDATIKSMLSPYNAELDVLKQQVIGKTTVVLDGARADVRSKETNLGNFIADGMLYKAKLLKNADIAIMNGGGIRAPIDTGDITMGELRTVMPFGNTLFVLDVTGQQLKDGLENGISGAKLGDLPGKFPQIAGMRFKWDPTQAAGSKVYDVEIKTATGYTALNLTKTYRMATNSFVALGGDGYTSFAQAIVDGAYHEDLGYADYEIFIEYMTSLGGTISPTVEGRIIEKAKLTSTDNGGYIPPVTKEEKPTTEGSTPANSNELAQDAIQVTAGTNAAGQMVNQVAIGATDLQAALKNLPNATGQPAELLINMHNLSGATVVSLPVASLSAGSTPTQPVIIKVATAEATYSLPLSVLNLPSNGSMNGNEVLISITPVNQQLLTDLKNKANELGAQLAGDVAYEFEVTLVNGNDRQVLNNFGTTFVSRTMNTPTANATNVTAVMLDPITGELLFVPHLTSIIDGKVVVEMKRPGNSTYTLLQYNKSFTDLNGHWAKNEIEKMASKMIIKGINDSHFAPNKAISRAEFTSLLVRSLGLTPSTVTNSFQDVAQDAWYASSISTAVQFGLVNGVEPNKFAPNATISRAEMAVMIARAITIVNPNIAAGDKQVLNNFSDYTTIPQWASGQVALLANQGIMQGNTKGAFAPTASATRAEAAVILLRALKSLSLLN